MQKRKKTENFKIEPFSSKVESILGSARMLSNPVFVMFLIGCIEK